MQRILIVDDDKELFELLQNYLKAEDFICENAEDGYKALEMLNANFDAIILDVMLPGMNGFEILQRIRSDKATKSMPVLMLTAKGEEVDRIVGLEMGADDYLGKPFNPRELVARLRAILRRSSSADAKHDPVVTIGTITINKNALSVVVNGKKESLSLPELRLLEHFADNVGEVLQRDFLYKQIFGHPAYPNDRSLDMLVSRLRRKLGQTASGSERIKAVRGEGYILLAEEA